MAAGLELRPFVLKNTPRPAMNENAFAVADQRRKQRSAMGNEIGSHRSTCIVLCLCCLLDYRKAVVGMLHVEFRYNVGAGAWLWQAWKRGASKRRQVSCLRLLDLFFTSLHAPSTWSSLARGPPLVPRRHDASMTLSVSVPIWRANVIPARSSWCHRHLALLCTIICWMIPFATTSWISKRP